MLTAILRNSIHNSCAAVAAILASEPVDGLEVDGVRDGQVDDEEVVG